MTTVPPHILPLSEDRLKTDAPQIYRMQEMVGYIPSALATVARKPAVLNALLGLVDAVLQAEGALSPGFRFAVAYVASEAAGCRYSAAHAAHAAEHLGEAAERIRALPAWRASPLFTEAETAIFALAAAAAHLPTQAAQHHFDAVRTLAGEEVLVEAMTVISLFGWFNRWNSAVVSRLEDIPYQAVLELMGEDWPAGAHAPEAAS